MEALYRTCCGVDVHKKTVVARLIRPGTRGTPRKETRTFGTMTADLLALLDWLATADCEAVAMESTGSFTPPTIVLKPPLSSSKRCCALTYRPVVGRGWPVRRFR
jgi:hypothetical protein